MNQEPKQQAGATAPNTRFLRACRREEVEVTPVWLMRQAGRYMENYRALRKKHTILEMIKTPELATEVTLQPVQAFDVDAAIIFADILTLPEAMGLPLEFVSGEGPVLSNPVRSMDDVQRLALPDPEEALGFTLEAIRMTRRELDGRIPLIGFSGSPFTLACYIIEGGSSREFLQTRSLMYAQPDAWRALMEKLSTAATQYLCAQVEAGAQVVQLFDSWAGLLSPSDYQEYVLPYVSRVFEALRSSGVPTIYFGTGTAGLLALMKQAGSDVVGVDWRIDLAAAWDQLGSDVAVQGNLDPVVLATAPVPAIQREAARILDSIRGRPGHIFNLGHGVLKDTPPDHVAALIDFVHDYSVRATIPQ